MNFSDEDPFFSIPKTPCGSFISTNGTLRLPVDNNTQLYAHNEVNSKFLIYSFLFKNIVKQTHFSKNLPRNVSYNWVINQSR